MAPVEQCTPALLAISLLLFASLDTDAMAKLRSSSWIDRQAGFVQVMQMPAQSRTAAVRLALIEVLERENAFVRAGTNLGEDFSEYYASVIQAVSGMRDPRSAKALLGALGTGGIALDGLVAIGEPAVAPAIAKLSATTSRSERSDICRLLREMTEAKIGLRAPVKNTIGKALTSCK